MICCEFSFNMRQLPSSFVVTSRFCSLHEELNLSSQLWSTSWLLAASWQWYQGHHPQMVNSFCFSQILSGYYCPLYLKNNCLLETLVIAEAECRTTQLGQEYRGRKSTTQSGRTCQRWDTNCPHKHGFGQYEGMTGANELSVLLKRNVEVHKFETDLHKPVSHSARIWAFLKELLVLVDLSKWSGPAKWLTNTKGVKMRCECQNFSWQKVNHKDKNNQETCWFQNLTWSPCLFVENTTIYSVRAQMLVRTLPHTTLQKDCVTNN